jgi:type II secretion system (T2SS) protein G
MRLLLRLFHWWLKHPWRAFWLMGLVFWIGALSFMFEDTPLRCLVSRSVDRIFLISLFFIAIASLLWGIKISWCTSPVGAVLKVGLPVLLCLILFGSGVIMHEQIYRKARLAKATADTQAIAVAVTRYSASMKRLPAALADLTTAPTSTTESGPFLERLPIPPVGWTVYRYDVRPGGTFAITSSGDGQSVTFPHR